VRKPPTSGATVPTAVTFMVAIVLLLEAERAPTDIGTTRSLEFADSVPIADVERVSATLVGCSAENVDAVVKTPLISTMMSASP